MTGHDFSSKYSGTGEERYRRNRPPSIVLRAELIGEAIGWLLAALLIAAVAKPASVQTAA